MSNPYNFPFEIVNKNGLIPNDKYYIKLNNDIIKRFLDKRQNLPVSHLEGVFVRLHTETDRVTTQDYAVFKKVKILNKKYKEGLCSMMLVRYPWGALAKADGCSTFSDNNGRIVNEDREVFLPLNRWIFGKPTEHKLLSKQLMNKLITPMGEDNVKTTQGLLGEKGGRKRRTSSKFKKNKISKRNKSTKNRTRRRR